MAKQVTAKIKLQCPGGQATPAPPVGPALGQHGVNIGQFVSQFNDRTKDQPGMIIPVEILVFTDRSFSFITKSPPAAVLLKRAAEIAKGAQMVGREDPVGKVTAAQVDEIAKLKMEDLNSSDIQAACRQIEGNDRSMGSTVVRAGCEGVPDAPSLR